MYALFVFGSLAMAADVTDVWVHAASIEDRTVLQSLGLGFAEGQDGKWLRMHADAKGLSALNGSGLAYRLAPREMLHDGGHLSPEEMVDELTGLADDHPSAAQLVHLGWSVEDRPIFGLRISHTDSPVRRVRILGAHHGDETASAEVALQTARDLLLDSSDAYASWLDEHEVWVVPHVNPDGVAALDRYNANNVDLNRNYDFMWSETEFRPGEGPFSEPETRNIRALGAWAPAGLGLSMHAGATNLGWVWNYTEDHTADEDLLEHMSTSYAESCTTDDFWITNGAEWYITNGDTTDWSYGRYGVLDFTLELSDHKHPGTVRMDQVRAEHAEAIRQIIQWPWWIAGQVVDEESGLGVPAVVRIDGVDQPVTTGPDGTFSRPITEDVAQVYVESPGFEPVELSLDPDEDPVEIPLSPHAFSMVTPEERSLNESGVFRLTGDATSVILGRPGHDSFEATRSGSGWQINPSLLQPGPWDITIDGTFAPRALFVPESDDRVRISDHWKEGETLYLSIDGLNEGLHAWALFGVHRTMLPLSVEADGDVVMLDTSGIPPDEPYYIIIWHSGRQLFLLDAHMSSDSPSEDTGSPETNDEPDDSGGPTGDDGDGGDDDDPPDHGSQTEDDETPSSGEQGSSTSVPPPIVGENTKLTTGCNTAPGYPALLWLVSLLGLTRMRSGQCNISQSS
jgi:carboxypeptidase T